MDLFALQTLICVKETQSFSRAAEQLFLTQPAVSKRIASLEHEMNARIFDRIGNKVMLTEAGKELYQRAKVILLEIEDCRRAITNLTSTVSGRLTLAISNHIGLHRIPDFLKDFTTQYPDVELDMAFMNSERAYDALARGEIELALVTLPGKEIPNLEEIPVWDDPLALAVNTAHPLAPEDEKDSKSIGIEDIATWPAILPFQGDHTRELIDAAFSSTSTPLNVKLTTEYLETIKMLISVGLGWGVLPRTMLTEAHLIELHVPEVKLNRILGAMYHRKRTLSNGAHALLEMLPRTTSSET